MAAESHGAFVERQVLQAAAGGDLDCDSVGALAGGDHGCTPP